MEEDGIIDKTIQSNFKPQDLQSLLDKVEECNFTNEQYCWIEQMLIFVNSNVFYWTMKEYAPKKFEKEVKEEVKGWRQYRGLKF